MEKYKITREEAINAASAGMANYFVDFCRMHKDEDFKFDFEALAMTALNMYSVVCYFNEDLIKDHVDKKKREFILFAILENALEVFCFLCCLDREEFCDKHFVGYKDIKEGKEKMDLKA